MIRLLKKLRNNVITLDALRVLGAGRYVIYLLKLVQHSPAILRSRDFKPLDFAMGPASHSFNYRGAAIFFDCRHCDTQLSEESFAFGSVRELYIRDCYFRHQPTHVWENAHVFLDLGANRGAFSSLVAHRAHRLLSVEVNEVYHPLIRHNLAGNNCENFRLIAALVGEAGKLQGNFTHTTIQALLDAYDIEHIDFVKMDIEGSEFSQFKQPQWLQRVGALTLEVHPAYGNPQDIVETLTAEGFSVTMSDENLTPESHASAAEYIYAWRTPCQKEAP